MTLPWDWWRWTRRSAWWPRRSGPPWPAPPAGNWTWGVQAAGRTRGSCWGQTNPVRRWGNWQSVLWGMADLVTDRSPLWPDKPCQKVRKLTVLWGIADMVAGKSPLWLMTAYIALFSILKHTHCFFVIRQTLSKVRKLTISSVGNTDLVTRKSPLWSDTPTLTLTDKQSPHLA